MKKLIFYALLMVAVTIISCGEKAREANQSVDTLGRKAQAEGDSTLYGLACEGCTDSVLVFLSFDGGDPVTFDIIDAAKNKRIIGRPETGDWVGVVLNAEDSTKADMVIDLDQLKGSWVYMAMPKLREKKRKNDNVYVDMEEEDSILRSLMVPREQGFALMRNSAASPIGMTYKLGEEKESPVVYPEMRRYTEWGVYNGRLVLTERDLRDTVAAPGAQRVLASDTAEFVFMMKDSLQLKFKDEVRNYYRKR